MDIDKMIQHYENKINNLLNSDYNYFYVQPYRSKNFAISGDKYGAILNGQQIAVARDLQELENIVNTIYHMLTVEV